MILFFTHLHIYLLMHSLINVHQYNPYLGTTETQEADPQWAYTSLNFLMEPRGESLIKILDLYTPELFIFDPSSTLFFIYLFLHLFVYFYWLCIVCWLFHLWLHWQKLIPLNHQKLRTLYLNTAESCLQGLCPTELINENSFELDLRVAHMNSSIALCHTHTTFFNTLCLLIFYQISSYWKNSTINLITLPHN